MVDKDELFGMYKDVIPSKSQYFNIKLILYSQRCMSDSICGMVII